MSKDLTPAAPTTSSTNWLDDDDDDDDDDDWRSRDDVMMSFPFPAQSGRRGWS